MSCPSISFIATSLPVFILRPRYTFPKDPCPMQYFYVNTQSPIWIQTSSSILSNNYKITQSHRTYPLWIAFFGFFKLSFEGCLDYNINQQLPFISMKPLLHNLTKFIATTLQLYAPLPFEFTADLHTLNAYLRSYSQHQEKLLESFVNRLADKLLEKMRNLGPKDHYGQSQNFDNVLRHYNSCTFKYPQLRLNLEPQSSEDLNLTCNILPQRETKPIYSQRSGREYAGIKGQRHKFGSKHRNKLNKESDKENLSINLNINIEQQMNEKPLKSISSQAQFMQNNSNFHRKKSADVSLKEKKQDASKNRTRYESNDSRISNTSSLKIKLKPKPAIDFLKAKQGVELLVQLFQAQDKDVNNFLNSLQNIEEETC